MKRFLAALLALSMAISLTACQFGRKRQESPAAPQSTSSSQSESAPSQPPQEDPDTPAGAAKAALDALVALDIETFSRYSDNRRDENHTVIFGRAPEEGTEKELMEAFVQNLSYTFSQEQINGDQATVQASITNSDLTGVINEIINFAIADSLKGGNGDYEGKLIELIQNAEGRRTTELELSLNRVDGVWKLHLDEKLADAICGGLVSSALELADSFGPLGEKLREYVPALDELD